MSVTKQPVENAESDDFAEKSECGRRRGNRNGIVNAQRRCLFFCKHSSALCIAATTIA